MVKHNLPPLYRTPLCAHLAVKGFWALVFLSELPCSHGAWSGFSPRAQAKDTHIRLIETLKSP